MISPARIDRRMRDEERNVRIGVDTTTDNALVAMDLKGQDVPATGKKPRPAADAARELAAGSRDVIITRRVREGVSAFRSGSLRKPAPPCNSESRKCLLSNLFGSSPGACWMKRSQPAC